MSGLRLMIVGEWRRQRRYLPWLALVIVIGAGATMAALTASRRADSAFARFRDATGDGHVFVGADEAPHLLPDLVAVPGVESYAPFGFVPIWPVDASEIDRIEGGGFASIDGRWLYDDLHPMVVDGRMPDRTAGSSMSVNEEFADKFDAEVGERMAMEVITEQGPMIVDVLVEGITRAPIDLGANAGGPLVYLPPGFLEEYPETFVVQGFAMVWLTGGDDAADEYIELARTASGGEPSFNASALGEEAEIVERATNVIATAVALVAVTVGIATLLLVALLTLRSGSVSADRLVPLRAAGTTRAQRAVATVAPLVATAAVALLIAAAVAVAVAPLLATGIARAAEPDRGVHVDPLVVGAVAGICILAVALVTAVATVRAPSAIPARSRRAEPSAESARFGRAPWRRAAAPVSVMLGARFASRIGVSTVVGAIVGLAGLVGAISFADRFVDAVRDVDAWGTPFDVIVDVGEEPDDEVATAIRGLPGVRAVASVAYADVGTVTGGSQQERTTAAMYGVRDVGDGEPLTLVDGVTPTAADQVVLGSATADRIGVSVGDTVTMRSAGGGDVALRVVGLALLPVIADGTYTTGIVTTGDAFDALHHDEPEISLWVDVADGVEPRVVAERVSEAGYDAGPVEPPSEQHNLAPVERYPVMVGIVLAVLGLAAMTGGVVSAVRRRRREGATLRALGLSSRQMFGSVVFGSAWTVALATVVGGPLGVLAGRLAWRRFAETVSLGGGLRVSLPGVAVVALMMAAVAIMLAIVPAARAARRPFATDLRAE